MPSTLYTNHTGFVCGQVYVCDSWVCERPFIPFSPMNKANILFVPVRLEPFLRIKEAYIIK